ncbi:hypothetical protein [Curtobacterium flaccumfaciens]|uniref:hypothetical protein n=1 Tax=Curtobacterium flaccumfaciens TaxID=2035 RepID=UPI00112708EC|nr:hypothetical protein [Curtobacterium flaccumfaciens]TPG05607.1 hypothetical protein EAH85_12810 [Curtobacterium flaccumfaciens]
MKHIVYGLSSVIAADDVAHALVHYAAVLAQARASDVVEVPTVDLNGLPTVTSMLLGPGIPLLIESAPDDELETARPEFVEHLKQLTRDLVADGTFHTW